MVLEGLRSLFRKPGGAGGDAGPDPVAIAACALLLEIGSADGLLDPEEGERILRHARDDLGIPEGDVREVMRLAEAERRESVDLYQFTRRITENFSRAQRLRLIEAMWGVVYCDGELAAVESQLARRVAELLGFQHPEVQAAKERVKAMT
ncbi:MAG: TerB family tellurite resistance protein [Thermoanaerobaculia bacterium]